jgi:hypothetical protein
MTDHRRKFVLVIGTGWTNAAKRRVARMIGTTLADAGLGLVAGNSTGVDHWVADSFCAALKLRDEDATGRFLADFAGLEPALRARRPAACRATRPTRNASLPWMTSKPGSAKRSPLRRGVMVGGGRGALDIARRIIDQGKPVFPLPFMGGLTGNSDFVFQEILKTWEGHPVSRAVSRAQFLQNSPSQWEP